MQADQSLHFPFDGTNKANEREEMANQQAKMTKRQAKIIFYQLEIIHEHEEMTK
jgi:hypothetical protein